MRELFWLLSLMKFWVLLLMAIPHVACAAACLHDNMINDIGVVQPAVKSYVAMQQGVVNQSYYGAGSVIEVGKPILNQTFSSIENRLVDLKGRIADLSLQLLSFRNIGYANTAYIDEYEKRNGRLSEEAIRRVKRLDEIGMLEREIARLQQSVRDVENLRSKANGVFAYPVLLVSDPPSPAETITEGMKLFDYILLNKINVSLNFPQSERRVPKNILLDLGDKCLHMNYIRSVENNKRNTIELMYQSVLDKGSVTDAVNIFRSPKASVAVYYNWAGR